MLGYCHQPVSTGFYFCPNSYRARIPELNLNITLIVSIIAGIGLLASAFTVGATTTSPITVTTAIVAESTPAPVPVPKTVKEIVNEYFKDDPIMIKVSWCESRFRQFDKDGTIFRGKVNPKDIGVMQVNTYYHEKTAEKLGIDLYTLEGNLAYAKYLYEKEGTTPWNSSSPCWMTSKAEVALL